MQKISCVIMLCSSLSIVGCQTTTPIQPSIETPKTKVIPQPPTPTSKVIITPYPDHEIRREAQPLPPVAPPQPPLVILPEQTPTPNRHLKNGHGIAAYEKLMQDYLQSLRKNNLIAAEQQLIQAQRIAPQSADVYRELARLANLKKQAANAEALARKGLTFAQNNVQRKQLWQQILQSAQQQNKAALIQQAQQNIAKY